MNESYFGGIPYGPDIKKLRDAYPDSELTIGQEIQYQDVADMIKAEPKTSRFYAVTRSWRKQVEKESGVFVCPTGDGDKFKVLSESEKLSLANREDRTATKKSRRSLIVLKSINDKDLTESEKQLYNFKTEKLGRVMAIQQIKTRQELPEMTA